MGVIYNIGGFQPAVGDTFLLVEPISSGEAMFLEQIDKAKGILNCRFSPTESKMNLLALFPGLLFSTHSVVSKAETNVEGKVSYDQIKAGQYKIFGITSTRSGAALWYYDVELVGQDVNLLLDSKKALVLF